MKTTTFRKLNTWVVLIGAPLFVAFVFLLVLFPNFRYALGQVDQHGIAVRIEKVGENYVLHVPPLFDYDYSSVHLQLETGQEFSQIPEKVKVYKGALAFAFEKEEEISSSEKLQETLKKNNEGELLNGQLVSYNDTIFVVADGKTRAVLSPEIFEGLGYDWDAVEEVSGDIFNEYEKGENITSGSSHPDGTIFDVDGELQIFLDGKRHRIPEEIAQEEILKKISPVIISDDKLVNVGNCIFFKRKKQVASCEFIPDYSQDAAGNEYIFMLPQQMLQKTEKADATFKTLRGLDKEVARKTLSRMKTTLRGRYFPELIR